MALPCKPEQLWIFNRPVLPSDIYDPETENNTLLGFFWLKIPHAYLFYK